MAVGGALLYEALSEMRHLNWSWLANTSRRRCGV